MMNIWKQLNKPIFCLAPMAGVTDSALRQVIAHNGRPDLFFTEFVSCAGLCSAGREKLLPDLNYASVEKPIIAQIFGADPDQFYEVAQLVAELGYDGIDINSGCPDKSVQKQKAGAMLMNEPQLAKEIIAATKRGANGLPVSIKTRIGYYEDCVDDWIKHLLEAEPDAISIHWRTKKQMYKGDARWDLAPKVMDIVRDSGAETLIIGNGDIKSLAQAHELVEQSGVDGVMIGRAIFNNPWIFNPNVPPESITWRQRIEALMGHLTVFQDTFGDRKHWLLIRKHIKSYITGFRAAKEFRMALQGASSAEDMRNMCADFLATHSE